MILDPRKANSTGNESDVFTTVNMPFSIVRANIGNSWWQNLAFTVMARFRQDFPFHLFLFAQTLKTHLTQKKSSATNSSMFVKQNVSSMIFGYTDQLLTFVHNLSPNVSEQFPGIQPNVTDMSQAMNVTSYDCMKTGNLLSCHKSE